MGKAGDSLAAAERAELEELRRRVQQLEGERARPDNEDADAQPLEDVVRERTAELEATSERLGQETADLAVALRRQRLLAKAVEAVREGVAITDAHLQDPGPRLLFVNDYFLEMSGYEAQELVGARMAKVLQPEGNAGALETLKRRVSAGRSFTGELACRNRDGEAYVVLDHVSPVFDDDGQLTHLVSISKDVTEQREHEKALRRSQERYRLLIEKMNEGFVATDPENRIDLANAKFVDLVGYSQEELRGEVLDRFVDEPSLKDLVRQEKRRRAGVAEPYELTWVAKNGTRVDTIISPTSLLDDHGEYLGSFAVITDITERKRMEKRQRRFERRIQKTQKMESLGLLAGGVAHDFNNLLVGMMGHAGLALMSLAEDSPVRPLIRQIETAALRASELTQEMLAYSGHGKFIVERVQLSGLVEEIAGLLKVSISKKVHLDFVFDESLPDFEGDPTQIRQIVMNLLTNASEAIGDSPGTIRVTTSQMFAPQEYLARTYMDDQLLAQQYIFLEVTDTGAGMDDETRHKIFDPFFTTKFTGRGLGLAAVLGIVRGHQGAIHVASEPGQGTTIRVLFPALSGSSTVPPQSLQADAEGSALQGSGCVLVVDDEEVVRGVAQMSLELSGFSVICANDGAQAVEVFLQNQSTIDAVLLDLTMPRMGGEEALDEIRRLSAEVPIILTSGFSEQEAIHRLTVAGEPVAFLQKPFQPQELIALLRQALGQ